MILFFSCFVAAILIYKIPILGKLMIFILIGLAIWFTIAVGIRYTEVKAEREYIEMNQ